MPDWPCEWRMKSGTSLVVSGGKAVGVDAKPDSTAAKVPHVNANGFDMRVGSGRVVSLIPSFAVIDHGLDSLWFAVRIMP